MSETNGGEWTVSRTMGAKEYHAIYGVSGSGLHRALRSPAHWKASLAESRDTHATKVGSALHTLMLEPAEFERRYIVFQDRGDKRKQPTKGLWEAAQHEAAANSKDILAADDWDHLKGMQATLLLHPEAKALLHGSELKEVSLIWRPAHLPFALKTRPDLIHGAGIVGDLKKTQDASPHAFTRAAADYGYFHQAAWNRWMLTQAAAAGMIELDAEALRFLIVAVEEEPPHGVGVFEIPRETLVDLVPAIQMIVATLAAAQETGRFDCYPTTIQTLKMPDWANK